jgi:hypothetical protein
MKIPGLLLSFMIVACGGEDPQPIEVHCYRDGAGLTSIETGMSIHLADGTTITCNSESVDSRGSEAGGSFEEQYSCIYPAPYSQHEISCEFDSDCPPANDGCSVADCKDTGVCGVRYREHGYHGCFDDALTCSTLGSCCGFWTPPE